MPRDAGRQACRTGRPPSRATRAMQNVQGPGRKSDRHASWPPGAPATVLPNRPDAPAARSPAARCTAQVAPASAARLYRRRTACQATGTPRMATSPRVRSRTAHRAGRRKRPAPPA
eukprot:6246740-Alexandrium_andersonii.AAC.1